MIYYNLCDDGTIKSFTESESSAKLAGLTLTTTKNIITGYNGKLYFEDEAPTRPVTVADYDREMEAHLKAEREARGYTTREPSDYAGSSNARWAQDATDWIAHRDAVMTYALGVENDYEAGRTVPTLDAFKAALPKITWTLAE